MVSRYKIVSLNEMDIEQTMLLFQQESSKGWHVDGYLFGVARFTQGKPEQRFYSVLTHSNYLQNVTSLDDEFQEKNSEVCNQGYTYVTTYFQHHIYYSTKQLNPLTTDLKRQVEKKLSKNKVGIVSLVLLTLFLIGMIVLLLKNRFIFWFIESADVQTISISLVYAIIHQLVMMVSYKRFLNDKSSSLLRKLNSLLLMFTLLLVIYNSKTTPIYYLFLIPILFRFLGQYQLIKVQSRSLMTMIVLVVVLVTNSLLSQLPTQPVHSVHYYSFADMGKQQGVSSIKKSKNLLVKEVVSYVETDNSTFVSSQYIKFRCIQLKDFYLEKLIKQLNLTVKENGLVGENQVVVVSDDTIMIVTSSYDDMSINKIESKVH